MQVRILRRTLLASKFFLAFLDLSPSVQTLNFFGLIFIPNFFIKPFEICVHIIDPKFWINFPQSISSKIYQFISMYSLKCFLWPRWLQDGLRLIQDQFGVVIQNKSSITHTRIRSGIFISAVLWSQGRFLGKSGTDTPPRTPRISGLKSQILKPTFWS